MAFLICPGMSYQDGSSLLPDVLPPAVAGGGAVTTGPGAPGPKPMPGTDGEGLGAGAGSAAGTAAEETTV
ncbi:hypothetical protein GCM10009838_25230 [Catenulispora subtropica]|uniref:Uncharacterized protein n=1 Tax=Catenulispora subtropica TaxID=450798 RepID=A0ABN2RB44_9ACTN